FDPDSDDGPSPGDTIHLNSVWARDGRLVVAARKIGHLMEITDHGVRSIARIPFGTHNAQPFRDGAIMNETNGDRAVIVDRHGRVLESFPVPRYAEKALSMSHLPEDHARQAFARGLAIAGEDVLIVGSSPATVTAWRLGSNRPIR